MASCSRWHSMAMRSPAAGTCLGVDGFYARCDARIRTPVSSANRWSALTFNQLQMAPRAWQNGRASNNCCNDSGRNGSGRMRIYTLQ